MVQQATAHFAARMTALMLFIALGNAKAAESDCAEAVCSNKSLAGLMGDATYDLGGYVKLDAIFDFDDAGDRFQFQPREIPVDGGGGSVTTFHARQTRLNLLIEKPTEYGNLDLFVEGDFFGSGNAFRLRHAYGRWGSILAGQTWSLLVDEDAFIETLDFAGADGATLLRTPQIRFEFPVTEYLLWKLAIEENTVDPVSSIAGETRNRFPVMSSGLRIGNGPSHLYCIAGLTEARFVPDVGQSQTESVWAVGLSSRIAVGQRDSFIGRVIVGDGADSLISSRDTGGSSVVAPVSGIETLTEYLWDVAYQHHWRDDLRSNFAYRRAQVDNTAGQSGDAIRSNQYLATNLIWRPVEHIDIGVEYLFGQRENKDRRRADANRLQFSFIWRLP